MHKQRILRGRKHAGVRLGPIHSHSVAPTKHGFSSRRIPRVHTAGAAQRPTGDQCGCGDTLSSACQYCRAPPEPSTRACTPPPSQACRHVIVVAALPPRHGLRQHRALQRARAVDKQNAHGGRYDSLGVTPRGTMSGYASNNNSGTAARIGTGSSRRTPVSGPGACARGSPRPCPTVAPRVRTTRASPGVRPRVLHWWCGWHHCAASVWLLLRLLLAPTVRPTVHDTVSDDLAPVCLARSMECGTPPRSSS